MNLKKFSNFCVFLLALSSFAVGQNIGGTFVGTVTDTKREPLPGVMITATNVQTGIVQATSTNQNGRYRLERLPRGIYSLTASHEGFQKFIKTELELHSGAELKVDFALEMGALEKEITVIGEAPLVDTTRSQVSIVMTEKEILNLPQQDRNYLYLMQYAPGTQSGARTMVGSAFAVNGMRGESNNYMIDGMDNNDIMDNSAVQTTTLPPEAIQEFRLITDGFSAEAGRNVGGSLNVVMKSGTNEIHGSGWFFGRGDSALFKSADWETGTRTPYERQQYGFTLGGPIVKDKTFLFLTFEGLNQKTSDIPSYFYFTQQAIASAQGSAHQFFEKFGSAYPTVTTDFIDANSDGVPDYGRTTDSLSHLNKAYTFGIKLDHKFSENDRVSLRFLYNRSKDTNGWFYYWVPGVPMQRPVTLATGGLTWMHILSPQAYNELRIGIHADNWDEQKMDSQISYFQFWDGPVGHGDPGYNQSAHNRTYQLADVLSFQKGNHAFKIGGELRYWTYKGVYDGSVNGNWTYRSGMDWITNQGAYYVQFGGIPPAPPEDNPYIRGNPQDPWSTGYGLTARTWKGFEIGLFAQDDWRISDRLTISPGLRWDYYAVPKSSQMSQPAFGTKAGYDNTVAGEYDITEGTFSEEGIQYMIFNGRELLGEGLYNPDYASFGPKISFAYDLTGDGKTSLRGGFGIAYERQMSRSYLNDRFNYPKYTASTFYGDSFGNPPLIATLPGELPLANATSVKASIRWMIPDELKTQRALNWFVGIQREIIPDFLLEVDYSGSKGDRLGHIDYINRYTGDGVDGSKKGINPLISISDMLARRNNTTSTYYGFQFIIKKRFSNGWSWYTAYTLSGAKNYSDVYQGGNFVSIERPDMEYGWTGYDRRHRVVGSFVFDLPFFKQSKNKLVKSLLSGWRLASSFNYQSGATLDVISQWNYSQDWNQDGVPLDRPIYTGGDPSNAIKYLPDGTPYLDRSLFQAPGSPGFVPTIGNVWATYDKSYYEQAGLLTRNAFRWFPNWNIDLSIVKDFAILLGGKEVILEPRIEVFNVLRSRFWQYPQLNYSYESFGQVYRKEGNRIAQLSMRIMF